MTSNDEQKFLLSCLVNGIGKIDFEAVARENGYTNPRSAANRLSALKKNAVIGTSCNSGDKPIVDAGVTRSGKITKRKPRNRKVQSKKAEEAAESTNHEEMEEEDDEEERTQGGSKWRQ